MSLLIFLFLLEIVNSNRTNFYLYEAHLRDDRNVSIENVCIAAFGVHPPINDKFHRFILINTCGSDDIDALQLSTSYVRSCINSRFSQVPKNLIFLRANGDAEQDEITLLLNNIRITNGGVWLSKNITNLPNNLTSVEIGRLLKYDNKPDLSIFLIMLALATLSELGAILFGRFYGNKQVEDGFTHSDKHVISEKRKCCRGICFILSLVVSGSCLLLLVYYFPKPMSYILHALFALMAAQSIYRIINAVFIQKIMNKFSKFNDFMNWKIIKLAKFNFTVQHIATYMVSLILPLLWIIFTYVHDYSNYSFIFQNICLMAIAVYVGSCMQITPFASVCSLLMLLLIYDVFFVYITPLLQSKSPPHNVTIKYYIFPQPASNNTSSASIMISAAMSLKNIAVLRIPNPTKVFHECERYQITSPLERGQSILGLGDVIVPVVLGNFCSNFDRATNQKYSVYTYVFIIAYAIGLSLAFVVSIVTLSGQPALLFINPVIILFVIILSVIKGQFKTFVNS